MPGHTAPTSLYRTIYDDIVHQIHDGNWPPGHRVPSEMDLAAHYGCSRMTVNKALSQLATEGYIERRRRAGSVVAQPHVQSAVLQIHDIQAEVTAQGSSYGYRLLARNRRPLNSQLDDHFVDQPGDILHIVALHFADDRPFCLEERRISLHTVAEAESVSFEHLAPGTWLLQQVPWNQATHTIRAVGASPETAGYLKLAPMAPCLAIERRTWNTSGSITHVVFTYAGDQHQVTARFTPPGSADTP